MNDQIPNPPTPSGPDQNLPPEPVRGTSLKPPPTEEELPIGGFFGVIEALLRQPRRVVFQLGQAGGGWLALRLFVIAALCSLAYGFVAGTFSGGAQLWAAPVKIAGGLLCAALICLPSLYIFACLGGTQARVVEITGLVGGLVALLSVLLVGFAPVAWLFSQSTDSMPVVGTLHIAFGLVAGFFGLRFVNTGFSHFGMSGHRAATGFSNLSAPVSAPDFWKVIFLLVALQMTTALRPIIGTADSFLPGEKKFFIKHWLECVANTRGQPPLTKSKGVQYTP